MKKKFRLVAAMFMLPMLLLSLIGTRSTFASPAAQASPQNWTVMVGADSQDTSIVKMAFYPADLTVHVGDTVIWMANSMDVHDVLFGPPEALQAPPDMPPDANGMIQFNPAALLPSGGDSYDGTGTAGSGLITNAQGVPAVQSYKLTFTKAGTYNYVCNFHAPAMIGSITVVDAATALPMTPDQATQAGKDKMDKDLADAQAQVSQIQAPASTANPDGTTTWNVDISAPLQGADYMRFTPGDLTIAAGDKVTWTMKDAGTPHTVTLASGGPEPDLFVATPQQAGPPLIYFNPLTANKQGGDVYDGAGLFNAGVMNGTQVPAPGPRSYTLTFTTPGTYEFYCILHDNLLMKGQVTVLAAAGGGGTGTPGMPRTGNGGDSLWLILGIASALALALAGTTLRLRKSSNVL